MFICKGKKFKKIFQKQIQLWDFMTPKEWIKMFCGQIWLSSCNLKETMSTVYSNKIKKLYFNPPLPPLTITPHHYKMSGYRSTLLQQHHMI